MVWCGVWYSVERNQLNMLEEELIVQENLVRCVVVCSCVLIAPSSVPFVLPMEK